MVALASEAIFKSGKLNSSVVVVFRILVSCRWFAFQNMFLSKNVSVP